MDTAQVVEWYDFICPFCYVAQARNAILVRHGVDVAERPFQIHWDIPVGGVQAGPRVGPMYARLDREAAAAGLPLNWPNHLPNTRRALAVAEWVRLNAPDAFHAASGPSRSPNGSVASTAFTVCRRGSSMGT